jgi:hypothetical protein
MFCGIQYAAFTRTLMGGKKVAAKKKRRSKVHGSKRPDYPNWPLACSASHQLV